MLSLSARHTWPIWAVTGLPLLTRARITSTHSNHHHLKISTCYCHLFCFHHAPLSLSLWKLNATRVFVYRFTTKSQLLEEWPAIITRQIFVELLMCICKHLWLECLFASRIRWWILCSANLNPQSLKFYSAICGSDGPLGLPLPVTHRKPSGSHHSHCNSSVRQSYTVRPENSWPTKRKEILET